MSTEEIKLPPQSKEIEQAVIAAVLMEPETISQVIGILNDACFYFSQHAAIWRGITHLYHNNEAIDFITVTEQIKRAGEYERAGGFETIMSCSNAIGSAVNVEYHARIIKELYLKRQMIGVTAKVNREMYRETTDFFECFDSALNDIQAISNELTRGKQVWFADSLADTIMQIKKAGESKSYMTGVKSGLGALDRQTMGFQPTDLIIIAARPAMGKTALITDFMRHQLEDGIPVGFFSLEMSQYQINKRMIAAETGIDLKQINRGGMSRDEWQRVDAAYAKMSSYPFFVHDKGGVSINEVTAQAKQWKLKHDIKILYLDYIQLCTGTVKRNGNREQEISEISRRLKTLGKELDIPVIALSQLSRACEARTDKRPLLSDLRESGGIEQDADLVMFPYRDEYYNDNAEPGLTELIIRKYRNGEPGRIYCHFDGAKQRFTDTDYAPSTPF